MTMQLTKLNRLIDKYFIGIWSLGFPIHYQLIGTKIRLIFKGIERIYTIVVRRGLENSTIISLTYTGLDYCDLIRINRSKTQYDYHNLPKYIGEVGGQLHAYEGLIWSERLYDAYHNNLQPLKVLPEQLTSVVRKIEYDIAKIAKLQNVDIVVYARSHLPEYAIAVEHNRRRIIVAWHNGISMRTEGLINEPSILVSVLGKLGKALG